MAGRVHVRSTGPGRTSRWLAIGMAAALVAFAASTDRGVAQSSDAGMFGSVQPSDPNANMLLEADHLVYNNDENTVSAVGNVRITYDGYTMVAQRVTYSRASGRMIAEGNVEIIQPNGSHIFAEQIDVTDDFKDGFVSSLHMEGADNTRFAAESAERRDGEIAIFNNGVYTACEPCRDQPEKPPLWQIRANRVIIDNRTRMVEYEGASFELWGHPIAYLPRFSHADPSIKRKTGFLVPRLSYSETMGFGIKNSFFWAMAPNYDVTLSETYYSNQGFLSEVEWRHRLASGTYNLRYANISQKNPGDFSSSYIDANVNTRQALMTAGSFDINERWKFGWNALFQTDDDFAQTYYLSGYSGRDITNEIFLTGLYGKNYFDLRAQKFLIQKAAADQEQYYPIDYTLGGVRYTRRAGDQKLQDQQGHALPVMDLNRVSDYPVLGGQVSLNVNVRNNYRHDWQIANYDGVTGKAASERFHGIEGNNGRATVEAEWKRSEIYNGAVVTASLSGQADAIWLNTENLGTPTNPLLSNDSLWRAMPAGMLEIRYPLVANDSYATHLFEPIAQFIARPDETQIGKFPNEDAQSLVFDTTNLFELNKFSGYDRVEGGSRANVGFRYSASFDNGTSLNLAAGQSFQLHGRNSFATADLVNAGFDSGLETARSDYVASAYLSMRNGLSVGADGRFDEKNLELRQGRLTGRYASRPLTLSGAYVYIAAQPDYSAPDDRHEVNGSASLRLTDNWRTFGSFAMDLEYGTMYSRGIGLAYDDSCFSFSVTYSESEQRYTGQASGSTILFSFGLRTIGDYAYSYKLDDGT